MLDSFDPAPLRAAGEALFSRAEIPVFDLARARSIVSFGADFLETWLSPVEYARQLAERRSRVGELEPGSPGSAHACRSRATPPTPGYGPAPAASWPSPWGSCAGSRSLERGPGPRARGARPLPAARGARPRRALPARGRALGPDRAARGGAGAPPPLRRSRAGGTEPGPGRDPSRRGGHARQRRPREPVADGPLRPRPAGGSAFLLRGGRVARRRHGGGSRRTSCSSTTPTRGRAPRGPAGGRLPGPGPARRELRDATGPDHRPKPPRASRPPRARGLGRRQPAPGRGEPLPAGDDAARRHTLGGPGAPRGGCEAPLPRGPFPLAGLLRLRADPGGGIRHGGAREVPGPLGHPAGRDPARRLLVVRVAGPQGDAGSPARRRGGFPLPASFPSLRGGRPRPRTLPDRPAGRRAWRRPPLAPRGAGHGLQPLLDCLGRDLARDRQEARRSHRRPRLGHHLRRPDRGAGLRVPRATRRRRGPPARRPRGTRDPAPRSRRAVGRARLPLRAGSGRAVGPRQAPPHSSRGAPTSTGARSCAP